MRSNVPVRCLAISCLVAVAVLTIFNTFRFPPRLWIVPVLQVVFTIGVWGFLIRKLWQRPHRWGLGIGIWLLFMFALQTYLWRKALAGPLPEQLGLYRSPWVFALYEAPIVIGAISCFYLWRDGLGRGSDTVPSTQV